MQPKYLMKILFKNLLKSYTLKLTDTLPGHSTSNAIGQATE